MNLLEYYIKKINWIKPCIDKDAKDFEKEMHEKLLQFSIVTFCPQSGLTETYNSYVSEKEWERVKKRGYFLW